MRTLLLIACLLSGTAFAKTVTYSCTPLTYGEALEIDNYYNSAAGTPGNLPYARATEKNSVPAHMKVKVTLGNPAAGSSFHVSSGVMDIKTVSGKSLQIKVDGGFYYDSSGISHLGSIFGRYYIEQAYLPLDMPSVHYTYINDPQEDIVYLTVCSRTSPRIHQ